MNTPGLLWAAVILLGGLAVFFATLAWLYAVLAAKWKRAADRWRQVAGYPCCEARGRSAAALEDVKR